MTVGFNGYRLPAIREPQFPQGAEGQGQVE